jgi:hypothetical protein
MPFSVSIAILSLLQAALVTLPGSPLPKLPEPLRLSSRWWALVPALSIVVVIAAVALESGSATFLSWLALVAVPPLAALALGVLVRGARPGFALATLPLFAFAWALQGSLVGEAAAAALSALACVALGWLLVSVAPAAWLRAGIYAMAAIDVWFVSAQLLQEPNSVLSAASTGGLPRLQVVEFGTAQMGFGDIFVAALVGCLLAARAEGPKSEKYVRFSATRQWRAAVLVAILALAFDLLFFAVDTLPATVPVAVALALVQLRGSDSGDACDREDQREARGG